MPTITPEVIDARQQAFLQAYPIHRTISKTCDALGLYPQRVSEWLANDASFAEAFGIAKERVGDEVEGEMLRRALAGESAMSDTLLIFATKRFRPEYRDSYSVNIKQTTITAQIDLTGYSREELAALLQHALPESPPLLEAGDER